MAWSRRQRSSASGTDGDRQCTHQLIAARASGVTTGNESYDFHGTGLPERIHRQHRSNMRRIGLLAGDAVLVAVQLGSIAGFPLPQRCGARGPGGGAVGVVEAGGGRAWWRRHRCRGRCGHGCRGRGRHDRGRRRSGCGGRLRRGRKRRRHSGCRGRRCRGWCHRCSARSCGGWCRCGFGATRGACERGGRAEEDGGTSPGRCHGRPVFRVGGVSEVQSSAAASPKGSTRPAMAHRHGWHLELLIIGPPWRA